MSKKFRVLSLDVSGSSTGWSFISSTSRKKYFGTIKTSNKDCLAKRLTIFRKELCKIIKKYKPTIILLEDTFVGRNPAVNKLLSKFGGVAEQLVYEFLKAPPIIISNKTVKAFFCVKTKEALFDVIRSLCAWDSVMTYKKYNDVADSLAQLLYYLQLAEFKIIKKEMPYGYIYE